MAYNSFSEPLRLNRDMHAPIEEYESLLNYVSQTYGTPVSPRIKKEFEILNNLERVYYNAIESMTDTISEGKGCTTPSARKYSMMEFMIDHMEVPRNLTLLKGKVSASESSRRKVDIHSPNFMNSLFSVWADINSRNRISDVAQKLEFIDGQRNVLREPLMVTRPKYEIKDATMRICTNTPNLQGLTTMYKTEFIVAEEGRTLVGADISSQESVIFFNGICRDEDVLRMYMEYGEIYRPVVAKIEGIHPNDVPKELRSSYKTGILTKMNNGQFPLISFKMGSKELARKLINYIELNPHYVQFMNAVDRQMMTSNPEMGGFMKGRTRVITERGDAGRNQLVNAPLQITAISFISVSMFMFIQRMMQDFGHWKTVEEFLDDVRPIYHAHDEIVLSVANKNGYPEYAKECLSWSLGVQFEDWVPLRAEAYVNERYQH